MRRLLAVFEDAFDRVLVFLAALVAISIGLFAILIPVNLFLIKMGLGNFAWLYELVEYALYVGVFLAAPWVLKQGAHVRVDVVVQALPPRSAARLELIVDIAGALLCILLCVYGTRSALIELGAGTLPDKDLRIETWIMMAVFALSFLLLSIEFLRRARRSLQSIPEKGNPPSKAGF